MCEHTSLWKYAYARIVAVCGEEVDASKASASV